MRTRKRVDELMDDPQIDRALHDDALKGLGRINHFSGSGGYLWAPIAQLARANPGKTIRVLDLASGGGDVACSLARRARKHKFAIEIHGADLSPQAVGFATTRADAERLPVRFFQLDALNDPIPTDYDIVTSTLFLHHLSEANASLLLVKMAAATRQLVLVDDLIRSKTGYLLAWLGCRLLSRSHVVHHDGPASVAGAFRIDEVRAFAREAELNDVMIKRHWPERFLLAWRRT